MANKLYEETYIQNIANAIREKTGKTDAIMVSQMASEIGGISVGGGSSGSIGNAVNGNSNIVVYGGAYKNGIYEILEQEGV